MATFSQFKSKYITERRSKNIGDEGTKNIVKKLLGKDAVPDDGGKAGSWDVGPEDELVMPKDDPEGHEDPPPDEFEADNGEFDADALSVLEVAFEGSVS